MLDMIVKKIEKTAKIFNEIAGWSIVGVMIIVVLNVILRTLFNSPILGTYEYAGFITVLAVSFGISYCLVIDAHIAIDFIIEKFSNTTQKVIDVVFNSLSICFMSIFTWQIFKYAGGKVQSNQVSPTTQTPFYIFVYIMAVCFIVLCLVLITKIKKSVEGVKTQ